MAAESSCNSGDAPATTEMDTGGGAAKPEAPEEAKPTTAAAAAAVAARESSEEGQETRLTKTLAIDPEKSARDKKTAAIEEAGQALSLRDENQPGGETPPENGKKQPATEVSRLKGGGDHSGFPLPWASSTFTPNPVWLLEEWTGVLPALAAPFQEMSVVE